MSAERRPRRRPPSRRVNRGRLIGMVVGAVALFALGAAFGKAIEENDAGDGTVTYDRTVLIRPLPNA